MSHSSSSTSESDSRATSRKDLKAYSPTNEDTTTVPEKWIKNDTGGIATSDISPRETQRKNQHNCPKPNSTAVRHRYKTHTQLIKEKLDHIKAEMQRISATHLDQRPKRKAYHPFVWNSLSPYRDTTEIDHLLTMSTNPSRKKSPFFSKENKYSNI